MKTILLPVDFSAASDNAIRYIAGLIHATDRRFGRVILLNSYYVSVYAQIMPGPDWVQLAPNEIHAQRGILRQKLAEARESLRQLVGDDVTVDVIGTDQPLLRSVLSVIEASGADLLVIGSDDPSHHSASEIADYVIAMSKVSPVPVLVVPRELSFSGVRTVLLPCDLRNPDSLAPLKSFRDDPVWRKRKVIVIHASQPADNRALAGYLADIDHELCPSADSGSLTGILRSAREKKADIIVALPGKHSFFYTLTHRNISEALCRNEEMPVLILK